MFNVLRFLISLAIILDVALEFLHPCYSIFADRVTDCFFGLQLGIDKKSKNFLGRCGFNEIGAFASVFSNRSQSKTQ